LAVGKIKTKFTYGTNNSFRTLRFNEMKILFQCQAAILGYQNYFILCENIHRTANVREKNFLQLFLDHVVKMKYRQMSHMLSNIAIFATVEIFDTWQLED
jgi:hypothetical protein